MIGKRLCFGKTVLTMEVHACLVPVSRCGITQKGIAVDFSCFFAKDPVSHSLGLSCDVEVQMESKEVELKFRKRLR